MSEYHVGQTVVIQGFNTRGHNTGEVVKVGRLLVTVKGDYGVEAQYRIDGGHINDKFGHSWVCTEEEFAAQRELAALRDRLKGLGAVVKGSYSVEVLTQVADLLEGS